MKTEKIIRVLRPATLSLLVVFCFGAAGKRDE